MKALLFLKEQSRILHKLLLTIVVAFAYFISAKLVALLTIVECSSVFAIWPPTGIALSALYLFGYRAWFGIFLGAFLLNYTLSPFAPSFQIAITNTLAPLLAYWLLQRYVPKNIFHSPKYMSLFFLFIITASLVTATGGTFALYIHDIVNYSALSTTWTMWFLGDFIGFLLITPIVYALHLKTLRSIKLLTFEGFLMLGVTILLSTTIFGPLTVIDTLQYPVVYFLFPPIIWAVLRFNILIASLLLLLITIFSIYGTALGYGAFVREETNVSLLLLQSFTTIYSITTLYMASIIEAKKISDHELIKSQKMLLMQSRHAAMGEIINMISHQWRQPLASITMSANNILADIELEILDYDEIRENLKQINTISTELSNTIVNFQNYFKSCVTLESYRIAHIIDDTLLFIKQALKNKNIKLKVIKESHSSANIYKKELMQVLLELINNAEEALKDSDVKQKIIVIKLYDENSFVNIEICDNGKNIDTIIEDKIFEPYFTTKCELNGSGLGLYYAKIIVEQHLNGSICYIPYEDMSCFKLSLPTSN